MIKLIKSTFHNELKTKKALANFIEKANFLSFGTECQKFEKRFSKWQVRKDCVMVNSGSSANLALIQALINSGYLKKGDRIGFSAVTWSTNVMPLIQLGLKAVPVDVELDSLNVSSRTLRSLLRQTSIKALFLTNLLGLSDDIDEIAEVCRRNKIIFIEDNCESLGSEYKGKKLGNFGLASTFSFYVGHHLSTIEGGAICTDNEELAENLRIVRAHGWDRNLNSQTQRRIRINHKINSTFYSRYTFYDMGYNFRPTEIAGYLGNFQLKWLPDIIKKRQLNYKLFSLAVYPNPHYLDLNFTQMDVFSSFAIPIICRSQKIREKLVKKCSNLVEVRPVVGGDISSQPFFLKYYPENNNSCPNAKIIHEQGLYMGNNPELTEKELQQMINIVKSIS